LRSTRRHSIGLSLVSRMKPLEDRGDFIVFRAALLSWEQRLASHFVQTD
jgi:hypothetical protein